MPTKHSQIDTQKIKIHPLTLRPRASSLPPALRSTLRSTLLEQDSIPLLSAALNNSLTKTHYLANLEMYIRKLLASGECGPLEDARTGDAVLARVMEGVDRLRDSVFEDGGRAVGGSETGDLKELNRYKGGMEVPRAVVEMVLPTVKRELERCVEVVEDD